MEWVEFKVSNDALDDVEELRRRIDEDGYLFFRQLQDSGKLLALRREMLRVMQQGGWLVPGTDPIEGIANIDACCTEGDLEYTDVYHELYRLQSFHESAHWPEVLRRDRKDRWAVRSYRSHRKSPVFGSRSTPTTPRRSTRTLFIFRAARTI